jgi:hypothetical protein
MSIERMREELKMARQRTAFLSSQLDSALISPFHSDLYLVKYTRSLTFETL